MGKESEPVQQQSPCLPDACLAAGQGLQHSTATAAAEAADRAARAAADAAQDVSPGESMGIMMNA